AEANGIPYRDELGRYGDFHALRYTWATFLQCNGVAQRFAMKLMRHSDIKLTSKVYTDEMQLPIYDAIKNLPRLDALAGYTQIRAQILGGKGETVSHPDVKSGESKQTESLANKGDSRCLAEPVARCQMERVKGIEPSSQAWEARILPLNHTRCFARSVYQTSPRSASRTRNGCFRVRNEASGMSTPRLSGN